MVRLLRQVEEQININLFLPPPIELPWPYCEVSVCLRSKKTNVILSTRTPKWNCPLRFTVKDLTRDVVTLTVYSKNASSVEGQLHHWMLN